eukprot:303504-Rhodomonas_salina.7
MANSYARASSLRGIVLARPPGETFRRSSYCDTLYQYHERWTSTLGLGARPLSRVSSQTLRVIRTLHVTAAEKEDSLHPKRLIKLWADSRAYQDKEYYHY